VTAANRHAPSRPGTIRFTDLDAPVYPEAAGPIRRMLADYGATLTLDPASLLAAAVERSGLSDFGDDAFRERLEILCRSYREEAGLSDAGRATTFEQLVMVLVGRLRIQDLLTRHPEIADLPVERPIVICGLPRTGTTHLHNLLAADPALRHLPYWESLEPVGPPEERGVEPDPRLERCSAGLDLLDQLMPDFERMHEMTVEHAHEELQLLAYDVTGMLFECTAHLPTWSAHHRASDQTASYGYLRRVLQVLQWLRGGTRWVLKSPQHLEQYRPLLATFPDATFVVTHRDPVAVTASVSTMVAYSARMASEHPDPVAIGRQWGRRIEHLLDACVRDREVLPDAQSIDVRFDDFMADEEGVVAAIYDLAAQPYDDRARHAMDAFRAAHPRGRHGFVDYDLAALGLDADERRRALAGYTDRFLA
jgi:hypothetical protein